MPLRLVLFDLVGTLLDERADYEALDRMMAQVVKRFGLDVAPKGLSGEFALAVMEIVREEPGADEPVPFLPFHEAAPDIFAGLLQVHGCRATDADKAWFWDTYLGIQRRTWRPYKDALGVLEKLHARGLTLGTVTDADRYLVDDILPRLPIHPFLTVRVSAEESGFVKPNPASFLVALERAEVSADDAAFIGGSYERDVIGARAAGIERAILLDRHRARTVDAPTAPSLSAAARLLTETTAGRRQG